jgi:hypothetical protein
MAQSRPSLYVQIEVTAELTPPLVDTDSAQPLTLTAASLRSGSGAGERMRPG